LKNRGYEYGALRTALSRAKASGLVESFIDEKGITRFRRSNMSRSVGEAVRDWGSRPEGFLLAVFSFSAEEESGRRTVRELLRYFDFKRIAQNTYINGMIPTAGLEAELRKAGVEKNLYLFSCPRVDESSAAEKLREVFDLSGRARALGAFLAELKDFLEEPGLDAIEYGRRFFYAKPVHYDVCFMKEPPIPSSFLPPDYPLEEVNSLMRRSLSGREGDIVEYYGRLCG
jgi:DNA-binding transcriptional regulator PaaX